MVSDGKIAEITLEPETKQVIRVIFHGSQLRFRCQRCAVFCCKLGGPKLSTKDIERLRRACYKPDTFLDATPARLKNRRDGSCVFLFFNAEECFYQCSVYDFRPTFCRLYPFQFEKAGPQSYALKFIPCCNGLNTEDGEIVNKKFFAEVLQKILFDLIDSHSI